MASTAGIVLGQTVTGLGGLGIAGDPVVTAINGNTITLSSVQTLTSGAALVFSTNVTTGANLTDTGSASAISLGTSASTGVSTYTGLISGLTTVVINGASGRAQSLTGYNTYTGATILSGASILRVTNLANGGVASGIGASSNAAANLVFNGGTLQYNGGTATVFQATSTPSVSTDPGSSRWPATASSTLSGTVGNDFLTASAQDNAALIFSQHRARWPSPPAR